MERISCAERIKFALNERGIKPSDLCKMTEISKSTMSQYMSGVYEPSQIRTELIARALNVSEAWLMGYDVTMDRKMPTPVSESGHSDDELISLWKSLTPDEILRVKDFVQGMIASRKEPLAHKD